MAKKRKPRAMQSTNGPMAAALVSAGIGGAALGMLTTWAEASPETAKSLTWWPPVGPLSGKAGAATGVYLGSWLCLHLAWRRRNIPDTLIVAVSSLLLGIGLLGTFPPVFQRVARSLGTRGEDG